MNTPIRLALVMTLTISGTIAIAAREIKPTAAMTLSVQDDNMTPYRNLAAATLTAFKANDLATARKKAKELESAWDKNEKALQESSRSVWDQIDKAMDDFIKPLSAKAPDAAKVQATYDAFIAKLQLAVKG